MRKWLCNLSQFKWFPKLPLWKIKTQPLLMLDLWIAGLFSPFSSVCLQSISQICGQWRSLKKGLWLVPLNNGSLGAGKRGPGTNVAIMLMVRITGDIHYWPYLRLLCRADCPAGTVSVAEALRFGHQGQLGWWAARDRQEEASAQF